MTQRKPLVEYLKIVGQRLQEQSGDKPINRADIVREVVAMSGYGKDSVLPSDHCYNITNNGIRIANNPLFLHVGDERSGKYKFVGPNFPYTGPLHHFPKNGSMQIVGESFSGKLTLSKNE